MTNMCGVMLPPEPTERMALLARPHFGAIGLAGAALLLAAPCGAPLAGQEATDGFEIRDQTVVQRCSRCHVADDDGRMSRISYLRKTPEGWQTSIRRMVALHGARLDATDARAIVRYLSDEQGLAPEELRPGRFEVERRLIDYDYPGDSGVEFTCIQCHSMGRVITQRRTEEEWALLLATHRGLYPLVDFQAFRRSGPAPEDGDPRHPMDVAIDHLSEEFPLETSEWSAWAATKRSPRLAGAWALSGYQAGRGPVYGSVTVSADEIDPDAFTTTASLVYPESGERTRRAGEALVYTGYQWRGRSNPGSDSELREVMAVERSQTEMSGRWFTGAYDETGIDVTLTRVAGPVLSGVYPNALQRGATVNATLYGGDLPQAVSTDALDFGQGVTIRGVSVGAEGALTLTLVVDEDATVGQRDLFAFGTSLEGAVVVHDGADRIEVTPATGMARVGGANFPKGFATFEAIAWDDGPDGEASTDDDLRLGRVSATWGVEEYAAVFGDDDLQYVGDIRQDGVFVPAPDGPNPDRPGNRNNVGDVWVVGTHSTPDGRTLSARAHLIVTVPLYMRFEPWREVDPRRTLGTGGS
jgi:quinohemoprotein amine dehydrogenase